MWIPEQTATFALYFINCLVFITVVEGVYCAVRTDSLYKAGYVSSLKRLMCSMNCHNFTRHAFTFNRSFIREPLFWVTEEEIVGRQECIISV